MYNFSGSLVKAKKNWHAGSEAGVPGWVSAPVWILTQQDLCPQATGPDLPGQKGLNSEAGIWESAKVKIELLKVYDSSERNELKIHDCVELSSWECMAVQNWTFEKPRQFEIDC